MAIYADLHTHTTCSDGLDTPVALLTRARAKGLSVVSITDHDSLAAYPDARQTAL
ncbi:MAG: PHP domain-containing protein, partial [Nitrospinota bacterium]|nr:PHP domain-containing protein [Nitrospinota bacterium]